MIFCQKLERAAGQQGGQGWKPSMLRGTTTCGVLVKHPENLGAQIDIH
jgi:hypothetical protein